jgi:hypothetical protein
MELQVKKKFFLVHPKMANSVIAADAIYIEPFEKNMNDNEHFFRITKF